MVTGTVNTSVLGASLGDLVLRIRGSNYNGQVLRLKSAKCTIGSGPSCTLRLHGRGVNPLHCLILRGPNGVVIRSWSPDTRVNGRTFTNAPLSAGDRLNIGSLEFEIVATGEMTAKSPEAHAFYTELRQREEALDLREKELQDTTAALQIDQNNLEAERRQWEELHNTQFSAESQKLDVRETQLQQEKESLDLRAKELEEAAAALQIDQNNLEAERHQWEELRNTQFSAESQKLDARKTQLQQEKESLDLREKELQDTAAALRIDQNNFEAERHQWEELCSAKLAAESQQRATAEEEQVKRLKAQQAELESQRQDWTL